MSNYGVVLELWEVIHAIGATMTDIVIQQGNRPRPLRVLGAAILRALQAGVQFWNIPVLGGAETPESRYFRTGRMQ